VTDVSPVRYTSQYLRCCHVQG